MFNLTSPIYDEAKDQIGILFKAGQEYDAIKETYSFFNGLDSIGGVSKEEWIALIEDMKENYEAPGKLEVIEQKGTIISAGTDNELTIPENENSAWVLYKEKLKGNLSEDSINNLENDTYSILKKLDQETTETGPVKGLIIGQVQSGKTASMAALMAMAADWGWNTFIILSGMVENLRQQTQKRLLDDLNPADGTGYFGWHGLDNVARRMVTESTQQLDFTARSRIKFINVVLKNKTRLENLIGWLEEDPNKLKQMKILVIDDEADQASINTKKMNPEEAEEERERARINELILRLVNVGREIDAPPHSMNYISYTATPYANFLNESGRESLYPKDFIGMLTPAKEYFGPREIFGYQPAAGQGTPGLNIIRTISERDLEVTKELQEGFFTLPESLIDSLCWFFIGTAFRRHYNIIQPTSMLVHTSQFQDHHSNVSRGINNWIKNTSLENVLSRCAKLYAYEKQAFSLETFRRQFEEYPESYEINDYPPFEALEEEIKTLINEISHIQMDEDGDLTYIDGIHLCIDNCAHTGIDEESQHIRLAYPTKEVLSSMSKSPAFIIVGGSTLSRGLTIEGLVSTYFLRATGAADTLMQMGRWFGYRRGYELMPRIWMTADTHYKFDFLTEIEEELREELDQFSKDVKKPSEYGPRVKNTEKVSWLRVTSSSKMQGAEEVDLDFTGANPQTIHFSKDLSTLQHNLNIMKAFIEGRSEKLQKSKSTNAVVLKDIKFSYIRDELLKEMKFHPRSRLFNNIEAFITWFEKVQEENVFENWNVTVTSSGDVTDKKVRSNQWQLGDYYLGKVERSIKFEQDDFVSIGVLRGPNDIYSDIDNVDKELIRSKSPSNENISQIRKQYGVEDVPQLIIYRIKGESIKNNNESNGTGFPADAVGIYMRVPGNSSSKPRAKALRVKMSYEGETEE